MTYDLKQLSNSILKELEHLEIDIEGSSASSQLILFYLNQSQSIQISFVYNLNNNYSSIIENIIQIQMINKNSGSLYSVNLSIENKYLVDDICSIIQMFYK